MPTPKEYLLSDDDRHILDHLKSYQERLGKSDAKFAGDHLSYSGTVWARIVSGEYWSMVKSGRAVMVSLARDLDRLDRLCSFKERFSNRAFIHHTAAEAVFAAVDDCLQKPLADPARAIFYLAPTRGGKTWICSELVTRYNAYFVQARERWTRSYFTCLRDIAISLDCFSRKNHLTTADMERRLEDRLNSKRCVLAIDEGEFFAAESLNLIKYLLNSTTVVLLVCCIPEAYDRWQRRFAHEASQILARSEAVIRLEPITAKLAKKFLSHCKLEEPDACAQIAATFANVFGHFTMLQDIASRFKDGQAVAPSDIREAGNERRVKWGLDPLRFDRKPQA